MECGSRSLDSFKYMPEPIQFYIEDLVERLDAPSKFGVVARTWHEQLDIDSNLESNSEDSLLRPLIKGEIGVHSFPDGNRDILHESNFRLLDRSFMRGDFCRKIHDDSQSGVIINVFSELRLQHAINGHLPNHWFTKDQLLPAHPLCLGDYVLYSNWVGQVEEIFNEALIGSSERTKIQPIYEMGGRFSVGEKCYPMTADGEIPTAPDPDSLDIVIKVSPIAVAISWSAINQSLAKEEAQLLKRPPQFWTADQLSNLVVMRQRGQIAGSIGERVLLKDPKAAAEFGFIPEIFIDPGIKRVAVNDLVICGTRSKVEVLWEAGERQWVPSTSLVPYINPDEYECWPGDFVLWKTEDEQRLAVVQSASFSHRIALVRWSGTEDTEQVSFLELDPSGQSFGTPPDTFGVRRGEFVLIHKEGTTNGCRLPLVPRIGEIEPWVQEQSSIPDVQLGGWRGELTNVGMDFIGHGSRSRNEETNMQKNQRGRYGQSEIPSVENRAAQTIDWFGQVVDLDSIGQAIVSLPNGLLVTLPVSRLCLYRDTYDDAWDEDMNGEDDNDINIIEEDTVASEEHLEGFDGEEKDHWGHMGDDFILPGDMFLSTKGPRFTHHQKMPGTYENSPPSEDSHLNSREISISPGSASDSLPKTSLEPSRDDIIPIESIPTFRFDSIDEDELAENWSTFAVLESAPVDHAFYNVEPAQPSKSFLLRLAKEYRALGSSLPKSILVRAYEDRTDLLRCLIVGPEHTPYEDAPFVIDWRLDNNFPHSPPIAHFLSWTNGNGRVNPNLYEEGKVCLSILGTWSGDTTESWNAARSSLLQAFVSIQGLVLVREPYYCEPNYEKMRGTEEGTANSRLYSEKAYVLSRGFVRRALEIPLGGLEKEVEWLYHDKGLLSKVIVDIDSLIARSQSADPQVFDGDAAVPRLTTGAVLTLSRILEKLRALLRVTLDQ